MMDWIAPVIVWRSAYDVVVGCIGRREAPACILATMRLHKMYGALSHKLSDSDLHML